MLHLLRNEQQNLEKKEANFSNFYPPIKGNFQEKSNTQNMNPVSPTPKSTVASPLFWCQHAKLQ